MDTGPRILAESEVQDMRRNEFDFPFESSISKELMGNYTQVLREEYRRYYKPAINLDILTNENLKAQFQAQKYLDGTQGNMYRIVRRVARLRNRLMLDKITNMSACFKISRGGTSTIYATLYCSTTGPYTRVKQLVSIGPTYQSQDGEYRSRLKPFMEFMIALERYRDYVAPIDEYFCGLMSSGEITFQTDLFFPASATKAQREEFTTRIDRMRLPMKLWIANWVIMFPIIHEGFEENHINDAYATIIYQEKDIQLLEKLDRLYITELAKFLTFVQYETRYPPRADLPARAGIKVFPMTVYEAFRVDDINFATWRELYITNQVSNLVLNFISPSFPFVLGWHIVQNAHAGMFENQASHDKFADSDYVTTISSSLREIDKYNYNSQTFEEGPRNNKFMRLSKRIQDAIIYADSTIKLTDMAFCMYQEHCGPTLADLAITLGTEAVLSPIAKAYSDRKHFDKLLFEYVYGFYCMNSRCGVIHGDLHMNNVTIYAARNMVDAQEVTDITEPHSVYILAPDLVFMFPHTGAYAVIIDSSRSVLGDVAALTKQFGDRFTELFLREQRHRILHIIWVYYPKLMSLHRAKIEELIESNWPLMFKVITAIDTSVFCSNWSRLNAVSSKAVQSHIAASAESMLQRVRSMADALVVSNMQAAVDGEITSPDDIEWPNLLIIRECFAEYVIANVGEADVVDVYNYCNEMKWDAEDYDSLGPFLSPATINKIKRETGAIRENAVEFAMLKTLDPVNVPEQYGELDKIAAEREREEDEDIIKFESWMLL